MVSNYIIAYITIGVVCGFCFDVLYERLDMESASNFERIFWFIAWPFFLVIFLWGLYKDDEK
jgi:hypothetical protein